jgi:hypothetical protein
MKGWGAKLIHQELTGTLGSNAHGPSQTMIWLQRHKSGDLSRNDLPPARRPPLTLGPQLEASLQYCSIASASAIAQHFLPTVPPVKKTLQRELGIKKPSRLKVLHFLRNTQKVNRVETSEEMLRILQSSKTANFDGITMGNESWFQYVCPSSEMFARSPANAIPRVRQSLGAKETMIKLFFTAAKHKSEAAPSIPSGALVTAH